MTNSTKSTQGRDGKAAGKQPRAVSVSGDSAQARSSAILERALGGSSPPYPAKCGGVALAKVPTAQVVALERPVPKGRVSTTKDSGARVNSVSETPPEDAPAIIQPPMRESTLKKKIRRHLQKAGFTRSDEGELAFQGEGKDVIRSLHRMQREERIKEHRDFLRVKAPKLVGQFAQGTEIVPNLIKPVLERVKAGTAESDCFRLASLTWSVPVSKGFGRRLRYLVRDEHNGKIMGIIAIGDPVFNLAVRDGRIGWNAKDKRERLVNIMDAYVLGAVPPYKSLLAGKLVACMVRSRDVYDDFAATYGSTRGIISGKEKNARLLAVSTSSSMGRSSVYNRLKLGDTRYMTSIGYTQGWGHFHIPDKLFMDMRKYLRSIDHSYADQNKYGQGPNWRLRTIRATFDQLGFRADMLKHGVRREVFLSLLADNAVSILKSGRGKPKLTSLLDAREVAEQALYRWVRPRASRRPEFAEWTREDLLGLFGKETKLLRKSLQALDRQARHAEAG